MADAVRLVEIERYREDFFQWKKFGLNYFQGELG